VIGEALAKGEVVDIEEFGIFSVRRIPKHFERNIFSLEFHEVHEETEIEFLSHPKLLFAINFDGND
jgi:nucleoid DNA-binding protein